MMMTSIVTHANLASMAISATRHACTVRVTHVTEIMEHVNVMQDILIQSVHQTVISLDVTITFIVTHATLAFMVISVTKYAQNTVSTTSVTEMVDVHVMLDMPAILVKPVLRIVTTLVVMNSLYAMNVIQVFMETTVTSCKEGFDGFGCCPENCEGGCNDTNFVCSSCKEGYHGAFCVERCPYNCKEGCSQGKGKCNKCIKGYWGDSCDQGKKYLYSYLILQSGKLQTKVIFNVTKRDIYF